MDQTKEFWSEKQMISFSFLADVLLEDSLKKSDNILDIFNYITRCTLDIILETAMGQAMGIQLAREST